MSIARVELEAGYYADLLRTVEQLRAEVAALRASRESAPAVELLARAHFDACEPVLFSSDEAAEWDDDRVVSHECREHHRAWARTQLAAVDALVAEIAAKAAATDAPSPESALDRATRWSGTEPPEHTNPGALLHTLDDRDEEPPEPDGEAFRGGEAEAFDRWQMDTWQREMKR